MNDNFKSAIISIAPLYRDLLVCFGPKSRIPGRLADFHPSLNEGQLVDFVDEFVTGNKGQTVIDQEKQIFLLWLPRLPKTPEDFGFLAHEVFHATTLTMDAVGARFSEDSEEVYAYLCGWLTQRIGEEFGLRPGNDSDN